MQQTETNQFSEPAIESIIAGLDTEYTGKLPVEAIRAARDRRDEAVPYLIDLIRKAARSVRDDGDDTLSDGHFFSLFLLTELRAVEALPAIIEAISLPDDGPELLFDDAITSILPRTLAALAVDSREVVEKLIANCEINHYVRWSAAATYLFWVRDGVMTRADAVERLRTQLRSAIAGQDSEFTGMLVSELVNYGDHGSLEEIREAYRRDLVDPFLIDQEHAEKCIADGDTEFHRSLSRCATTGIADSIDVLSSWHAYSGEYDSKTFLSDTLPLPGEVDPFGLDESVFDYGEPRGPLEPLRNAAPKVGRNDPCPCRSGKKFKKCCGAG